MMYVVCWGRRYEQRLQRSVPSSGDRVAMQKQWIKRGHAFVFERFNDLLVYSTFFSSTNILIIRSTEWLSPWIFTLDSNYNH